MCLKKCKNLLWEYVRRNGTLAKTSYYSYSLCQLCSSGDLDLSTTLKIVSSPPYFPSGILWNTLQELQDHSSINHMSVLMHIQISIVTPLYLIQFVTGICFPHLYLYLVYLCDHLKVALGHTCEISHCCYSVCPRTACIHKSFIGKNYSQYVVVNCFPAYMQFVKSNSYCVLNRD